MSHALDASDTSGVEAVVRSDAALLEEDLAAFLASLATAPARPGPSAPQSVYEAVLGRSLYAPVADAVGSKVGQQALAPTAGAPAGRAPLRPSMVFWAYRNYRGFPGPAGEDDSAADLAAVRRAAVAVRVLLKAAVALDDIQDGSGIRYGEPALHVTHGIPLALNTGSLLITAALEHAADPAVVRSLLQSVGRGLTGQAVDVSTRTALTRAELAAAPRGERVAFWESMAALKTGTLFRMPLDAAVAALGVVEDERRVLDEAMRNLGLASQLFNDLTDFVPEFGGRATHEDFGQLSNRVLLELLDSAPDGLRASGELVGARLKEFVLGHPELRRTLLLLAAQAVELKRSAMEAVRGVCRSEHSARYFDVTIERKGHLIDRLHTTLLKGDGA
ncbi:polyprenyl synthetase family protein [Streptomyces sp. NBC_00193]|uniref:polyprenyl synthetase family protein n=1 Tax=Streptomyces sp. NBC_00193 TaxID=2975675 RepID=UPI00224D8FC7|nr:polyprenyl synthetase family protein [Streptomyces sp. NBC_00193]MCX5296212.1 polyprenyl synthetase family protein [Streptomyces sp. NBC_00193]